MDQSTINIIVTIALLLLGWMAAIFGWFAKELYRKQEATHDALGKLKEDVAGNYVSRPDLVRLGDRLEAKLDRFFDLLQKKQDKE